MFVFVILTLTSCFSITTYSFIKRLMTIENNISLVNTAHAQTSYPKDPRFKKNYDEKKTNESKWKSTRSENHTTLRHWLLMISNLNRLIVETIVCCHWLLLVTIENAKQSVVKWQLLALSHRNWVVVDRNDKYLTSVDKPVLAQVVPHFEDGKLCLNAPSMDTLRIPIQLDTKEFKDLKY